MKQELILNMKLHKGLPAGIRNIDRSQTMVQQPNH